MAAAFNGRGLLGRARFVGASSGALVAAALAAGLDPTRCFEHTVDAAEPVLHRRLGPAGRMSALVRDALERALPDDAHRRSAGRFWASVTTFPCLAARLLPDRALRSKQDVIEVVLASCYIPLYYERVVRLHGVTYLDGGLRNNQPRLDARTITVSPFRGRFAAADIQPSSSPARIRSLLPSRRSLYQLFDDGQRDGERFLRGNVPAAERPRQAARVC